MAPSEPRIGTMLRAAVEHHQAGRLAQAETIYRQVLNIEPDNGDALGLMGALVLQGGDARRAAELCGRAVQRSPRNHSNHMNLGLALLNLQRVDEGYKALQKAVKIQPRDPQAQFNLGLAAMQMERFRDAVRAFTSLDKLDPNKPPVLMHLGIALARDGRLGEAVRRLRRAAELAPEDVAVHHNLGRALLDAGDAESAVEAMIVAAQQAPDQVEVLFGLAEALAAARRRADAVAAYREVLQRAPEHVDTHNNLGVLLRQDSRLDEAETHLRQARDGRPEDIELWSNLGDVLSDAGSDDEAAAAYQHVIEAAPDNPMGYRRMTLLFQKMGAFDRARMVLDRAWQLDVADAELLYLNSVDRDADFPAAAQDRAETLIGNGKRDPESAATARFALAQVLERRRDYDAAFTHLAAGNRLFARQRQYAASVETARVEALERVCDADYFAGLRARGLGSDSEAPVFVLGMPRSGTTLVEQIIAGHSRAAAAGELGALQEIEQDLLRLSGTDYPDCLAGLDPGLADACAERYLDQLTRAGGDAGAARITDKMPANAMRLGLIALLLPRARIIHCRRSPMATCFSIYQQRFTAALDFAFDPASIGHYYGLYARLMAHWRRVCPLPVHEVRYEDLIGDPEGQVRALLDAAGLDWEDGCLRFFESAHAVNTASLWQVRQPIYDSSLEKWRRYETHLGPLREALIAAGVDPDG